MIKKIFIKLSLLIVITICLNLVYNFLFYEKDLRERSKEISEIRNKQDATDIFYFGESSNVTFKDNDSIKNSISEMINLFYPSLKLTTITKYATHAGIYKHWLNQINVNKKYPKAIIVTLNLRSFGSPWINSPLETALQQDLVLIKSYPNLINRVLLSFNVFEDGTKEMHEERVLNEWKRVELKFPFDFKYKTVREWDDALAQTGWELPEGDKKNSITLACHYVKGYAFNINENNPRIQDFDEIADWCDKNKINLYLNLLAENIQYADSLVGKELVFLMKQNKDFLVKRYTKNNCFVIDNLEMVSGKEFIDQNWTTEHYSYKGRMIIAKNVAVSLKNQFLKEYKNVY